MTQTDASGGLVDWPPAARIEVRVTVWGVSGAEVERALHRAEQRPARNAWRFAEPERRVSGTCTLDVADPGALAAEAGYGWAYLVHKVAS